MGILIESRNGRSARQESARGERRACDGGTPQRAAPAAGGGRLAVGAERVADPTVRAHLEASTFNNAVVSIRIASSPVLTPDHEEAAQL